MATTVAQVPRTAAQEESRTKWLTLGAMCFALFMLMLDNTVVNVALPTIQQKFNATTSALEWIVNGYTLSLAVLMVTMGKLGDIFGRKRVFLIGLTVFTAASLACGIAPKLDSLIFFRVLQGLGGSIMMPGTLSIITATFHGQGARAGDRHLGGHLRPRARGGPDRRWRARSVRQLAGDLLRQCPHRHRRLPDRLAASSGNRATRRPRARWTISAWRR